MSSQFISNIYNILRSESSITSPSPNIFILQVLSWLKLSQQGILHDEKKFEVARFAEGPIHPSLLEYLFLELTENPDIGLNAKGFEVKKGTISRMNHSTLTELLDYLWSAYQSNIIDYKKAVWEIVQYSNSRSDLTLIPYEVATLATEIAAIQPSDNVYCPFESSYNGAIRSSDYTDNIFTESHFVSPYPYIVNILCDINLQPKFSDPIEAPTLVENGKLRKFDVTLAFPPFGIRYRKKLADIFNRFPEKSLYGEVLHIRHCIAQTKRKAIIAVPLGVLFRTSAGEKELKQDLIENRLLETIISLPPALLPNTTIPFALIVLNLRSDNALPYDILFVDASSENFYKRQNGRNTLDNIDEIVSILENPSNGPYSELVSSENCADNDFNLLPNRYVLSSDQKSLGKLIESSKVVELKKIADLARSQSVRSREEGIHEFLEVMVSDVPLTGYISKPERTSLVSNKMLSKAKQQCLEPLDILLSTKGTIGEVGIVPPNFEGEWLAGQSFQILRLKNKRSIIDPRVLYMYLRSSVGQEMIKSKAAGTAVQMIQVRDIKTFPVIILTNEEQQKVLESFEDEIAIQQKMNDLRKQLDNIKKRHWNY